MKIRKILILSCMLLFLFPFFCKAEDLYIAQTATGSDTGTSCSDAHSIVWFNAASNWGSGAALV